MAWSEKQKKAQSQRMKAMWTKKKHDEPYPYATAQDLVDQFYGTIKEDSYSSGPQFDMVNRPSHYTFGKYEVIDVLEDWFPADPLMWNATKYLPRYDKKGDPIENLEKAIWYLQRKINKLKEEQDA